MKQEIVLTATGSELTIREGKALELKEPRIINIDGDINTVANFLKVRSGKQSGLQTIFGERSVVIVDKAAMHIELQLDPENHYGATISGKAELSDELKLFSINTTKLFNRDELVKIIKFNKRFFADADAHFKVLSAYQTFAAKAEVNLNQSSDTRGNKTNNFDKKVTSELPDSFVLNIPIIKGQNSRTFRVEICLDLTDGGGRFWFESVELHELIEGEKQAMIDEQLKSCEGLVIIYK